MAAYNYDFLILNCQDVPAPPSRSGPDRTPKPARRSSPYERKQRLSAPPIQRRLSLLSSDSGESSDSDDAEEESLGPEWAVEDEESQDNQGAKEKEEKRPVIRKPAGEVGRPARGGYNLENELSWDKDKYAEVRVS